MQIRGAEPGEAWALSDIAIRSKAYWGYSQDFLEKCRDDLTITETDIQKNFTRVLEGQGRILGFYMLTSAGPELEAMFIQPDLIGQGAGKMLWEDLIIQAQKNGIRTFIIHSDPYAEAFYLKMGAVRSGEVTSTVFPDRQLPLLRYDVP